MALTNSGTQKKLLQTLTDKKTYTVHYRALQLYVELVLEVTGLHRVLKFKQSRWLQPYVSYNSNLRKKRQEQIRGVTVQTDE